MIDGLRARVDLPFWGDDVHLWLYQKDQNGRLSVSTNLVMEAQEPGAVIDAAPIKMQRSAAQELMDQLWQVGLRPTEGSGSAGSLAATERHLQDMRSLVFKLAPKAVA